MAEESVVMNVKNTESMQDEQEQEYGETGPFIMRRTIRSTDYDVAVYFSRTSRETLKDKILRLIRNEIRHKQTDRRFSNATGEE